MTYTESVVILVVIFILFIVNFVLSRFFQVLMKRWDLENQWGGFAVLLVFINFVVLALTNLLILAQRFGLYR